jgi:hypothetical protein
VALTPVVAGTPALASALNQYRDHLQGAGGSTDAWHFRSAGGADFIITLSDAAGARKLSIRDSGGVEVASIDSDGTFSGLVLVEGDTLLSTGESAGYVLTAQGDGTSAWVAASGGTDPQAFWPLYA